MPTAAPTPAGPPLPPYQEAVTLGEGIAYPVRARSVTGWGYELVDKSEDYDLLVNRDIFGVFLNQLWPDLLKQHPKGIRITFTDPVPGVNYQGNRRGFGDGESGWVADVGCSTTHEEHNTIWPNELVECNVTLVSPGPGLTDLAIAAAVLGYGRAENGSFSPVFDREPFTLLGKPVRDIESGQWRWSDPFLQVVSLKPVAAPAAAVAPAAPKGPLPPPSGRIAFTRGRDYNAPIPAGYNDIAVVDVKTGEVRVVAQYGRQPDMRSDGRIVFNGEGGGREDLHTVEPDGSNLTQIGAHPEDSYPSWSDGAAVAFHSQLAGPPDRIFVQWNTQGREEPSASGGGQRLQHAAVHRPLPGLGGRADRLFGLRRVGQPQQLRAAHRGRGRADAHQKPQQRAVVDAEPRGPAHRCLRRNDPLCLTESRQLGSLHPPGCGRQAAAT